ncbi:hypothetical protein QJS66_20875 [Kocuria rhizophila]|nr:hypothetical protein QJS66_20875 [Kocuria rhizophila]
MVRDRPVAGPRSGVVIVVVSVLLGAAADPSGGDAPEDWAWPERAGGWAGDPVCMSLVLAMAQLAGQPSTSGKVRAARRRRSSTTPSARVLGARFKFEGDPDAPALPTSMTDQWALPSGAAAGHLPDPVAPSFCRQDRGRWRVHQGGRRGGQVGVEVPLGRLVTRWPRRRTGGWFRAQPGADYGVEGQTPECRKGDEAVLESSTSCEPDAPSDHLHAADIDEAAPARRHRAGADRPGPHRGRRHGGGVPGQPPPGLRPTVSRGEGTRDRPAPRRRTRCSPRRRTPRGPWSPSRLHGHRPTPLICPQGVCAPRNGNVNVAPDFHHLTWDYARSMAPLLRRAWRPWSPEARAAARGSGVVGRDAP